MSMNQYQYNGIMVPGTLVTGYINYVFKNAGGGAWFICLFNAIIFIAHHGIITILALIHMTAVRYWGSWWRNVVISLGRSIHDN